MNVLRNLLIFVAANSLMSSSSALTAPTYNVNDIDLKAENVFLISGQDPYLRFTPHSIVADPNGISYLTLNLLLTDEQNASADEVQMELFFNEVTTAPKAYFDPNYRLQFSVPKTHLRSEFPAFILPIPGNTQLGDLRGLRLDINGCTQCRFKALAYPSLSSVESSADGGLLITPSVVFNGLTTVPNSGIDITDGEWKLNDLNLESGMLSLSGSDPFLVSPEFNIDTAQLGGVYVRLSPTAHLNKTQDLQLFYATEQHGFVESASTSFRAAANKDGALEFIVPLSFLSNGHPKVEGLRRIRLDLDGSLVESKAMWALNEAKIVHVNELATKAELIPEARITNKRQRAHGLRLVLNVLKKVTSDIGFVIAYLLLLAITVFGFWRSYRK